MMALLTFEAGLTTSGTADSLALIPLESRLQCLSLPQETPCAQMAADRITREKSSIPSRFCITFPGPTPLGCGI